MAERVWAIQHTGGCNGKTNGAGLTLVKSVDSIPAKLHRCGDKDCRVAIVEVRVLKLLDIKPANRRLPTFEEGALIREGR